MRENEGVKEECKRTTTNLMNRGEEQKEKKCDMREETKTKVEMKDKGGLREECYCTFNDIMRKSSERRLWCDDKRRKEEIKINKMEEREGMV